MSEAPLDSDYLRARSALTRRAGTPHAPADWRADFGPRQPTGDGSHA